MRKERARFIIIILFLLPLSCISSKYGPVTQPTMENEKNENKIIITEITRETGRDKTKINFFINQVTDYTIFKQNAPVALVLDIPDTAIHESIKKIEYEDGPIKNIEPIQKEDSAKFIINLAQSTPYNVEVDENSLVLIVDNLVYTQQDVDRGEDWQKSIAMANEAPSKLKSDIIRTIRPREKAQVQKEIGPEDEALTPDEAPLPVDELLPMDESHKVEEIVQVEPPEDTLQKEELKDEKYDDPELREKIQKYTGELIALDFQDADIRSVLRLIADISGRNLVIDPKVKGRVNIRLTIPIPWDQALDVILKTHNLDMIMEENIIRIGTPQTFISERQARKNAIIAKREAQEEVIKLKPLISEIIPINFTTAESIAKSIKPMLSKKAGLAAQPSIMTDKRTNIVIIKDLAESIEKMKKIIALLDKQTPQVMIEARIVTTSKNYARQLGVQWGGTHSKLSTGYDFPYTVNINGQGLSGYAVSVPPGGAYGQVGISLGHIGGTSSLDFMLAAMEEDGEGKVISNPRIATMDNEAASITSGVKLPYLTVDDNGRANVTFQSASINLSVTPHITPNNSILLNISASKNSPDWGNAVAGQPAINQNSVKTKYIVKSGETAVIGGLMETSDSLDTDRVPWFASIPIVGFFFKNKNISKAHNELLIFITPLTIDAALQ